MYEDRDIFITAHHWFNEIPPEKNKIYSSKYLIWKIKYSIASFIYLYVHYRSVFNVWSSKYFPFSRFNRGKLYHYSQRGLRRFIQDLESIVEKEGKSISILDGDMDNYFFRLYTVFTKDFRDNYDSALSKVEKAIQKKYKDAFVRDLENYKFMILVPLETYILIIKKFERKYK